MNVNLERLVPILVLVGAYITLTALGDFYSAVFGIYLGQGMGLIEALVLIEILLTLRDILKQVAVRREELKIPA